MTGKPPAKAPLKGDVIPPYRMSQDVQDQINEFRKMIDRDPRQTIDGEVLPPSKRSHTILITDGEPEIDKEKVEKILNKLQNGGVYTVDGECTEISGNITDGTASTSSAPAKAPLQGDILFRPDQSQLLPRLTPKDFIQFDPYDPNPEPVKILGPDRSLTIREQHAKAVDGEIVSDTPFDKNKWGKMLEQARKDAIQAIADFKPLIDGEVIRDTGKSGDYKLTLGNTTTGKSALPEKPAIDPGALLDALREAMAQGLQDSDPLSNPAWYGNPEAWVGMEDRPALETKVETDDPKVDILPPAKFILFDEFEKADPRPMKNLQRILHKSDPYNFPAPLPENMDHCQSYDLEGGKTIDGDYSEVKTPKKLNPPFKPG